MIIPITERNKDDKEYIQNTKPTRGNGSLESPSACNYNVPKMFE